MVANRPEVNDIIVRGGKQLAGTVITNGAKNSSVALIPAALLNKGTTILKNVTRITDVERQVETARSLGAHIEWIDTNTLKISRPDHLDIDQLDPQSILKGGRASLLFLGCMAKEHTTFRWPHSGGCKMGERTITAHRHSLHDLGISIKTEEHEYIIEANSAHAGETTLYEASDTATENILITAATIPGTTVIHFAQANYMVQELCFFLEMLGVQIEGIGSTTLTITGKKDISVDVEYTIAEDPIESMMFLSIAATTRSEIKIMRCPLDFLRRELIVLEQMGLSLTKSKEYVSANGKTKLIDITVHPSDLKAVADKIHATPYPGINTDNLPFFVPIATQAHGLTLIHDWMWENRAIYYTELNRLGADVRIADPHRVFIDGPTPLKASRIVCPPALRPSTIILVAMLAAQGESTLHSVNPINRGYENIFERLKNIGADIEILS